MPHAPVPELAKRVERPSSRRFLLHDGVWLAPGVADVTSTLQVVEDGWSKWGVRRPQHAPT